MLMLWCCCKIQIPAPCPRPLNPSLSRNLGSRVVHELPGEAEHTSTLPGLGHGRLASYPPLQQGLGAGSAVPPEQVTCPLRVSCGMVCGFPITAIASDHKYCGSKQHNRIILWFCRSEVPLRSHWASSKVSGGSRGESVCWPFPASKGALSPWLAAVPPPEPAAWPLQPCLPAHIFLSLPLPPCAASQHHVASRGSPDNPACCAIPQPEQSHLQRPLCRVR